MDFEVCSIRFWPKPLRRISLQAKNRWTVFCRDHFHNRTRIHISKHGMTGSYWFTHPLLSWQLDFSKRSFCAAMNRCSFCLGKASGKHWWFVLREDGILELCSAYCGLNRFGCFLNGLLTNIFWWTGGNLLDCARGFEPINLVQWTKSLWGQPKKRGAKETVYLGFCMRGWSVVLC